jgi:hypothetical protein
MLFWRSKERERKRRCIENRHAAIFAHPELALRRQARRAFKESGGNRSRCRGRWRVFMRLERQQAPEYLWIGCSDSRVPANEIVGVAKSEE